MERAGTSRTDTRQPHRLGQSHADDCGDAQRQHQLQRGSGRMVGGHVHPRALHHKDEGEGVDGGKLHGHRKLHRLQLQHHKEARGTSRVRTVNGRRPHFRHLDALSRHVRLLRTVLRRTVDKGQPRPQRLRRKAESRQGDVRKASEALRLPPKALLDSHRQGRFPVRTEQGPAPVLRRERL